MSPFRVMVEVTTDEVDRLVELLTDVAASIEGHLPGTLAWETFVDEISGRALIYEVHRDEAAADDYERYMESEGLIEPAFDLFTSARVVILSPVHGSIWSAIAARPTSEALLASAGFTRSA